MPCRFERVYQTRLTVLDAPGKGFSEMDELLKRAKKKVSCHPPVRSG